MSESLYGGHRPPIPPKRRWAVPTLHFQLDAGLSPVAGVGAGLSLFEPVPDFLVVLDFVGVNFFFFLLELLLELVDGNSPALFRQGGDYSYLVMPLT